MKKPFLLLTAFVLLASLTAVASGAGSASDDSSEFTPLNNKDILLMVQQHVETDVIVKAIMASPCTFDTFPPVLREMKRRGVPEVVLKAMVEAPYGPSVKDSSRDDLGEQPIYHYAEQLKQMGYLTPLGSRGGLQPSRREARARASSRTRPSY